MGCSACSERICGDVDTSPTVAHPQPPNKFSNAAFTQQSDTWAIQENKTAAAYIAKNCRENPQMLFRSLVGDQKGMDKPTFTLLANTLLLAAIQESSIIQDPSKVPILGPLLKETTVPGVSRQDNSARFSEVASDLVRQHVRCRNSEAVSALFDAIDSNQNGVIEKEEWNHIAQGFSACGMFVQDETSPEVQLRDSHNGYLAVAELMSSVLDRNGNGALSVEELTQAAAELLENLMQVVHAAITCVNEVFIENLLHLPSSYELSPTEFALNEDTVEAWLAVLPFLEQDDIRRFVKSQAPLKDLAHDICSLFDQATTCDPAIGCTVPLQGGMVLLRVCVDWLSALVEQIQKESSVEAKAAAAAAAANAPTPPTFGRAASVDQSVSFSLSKAGFMKACKQLEGDEASHEMLDGAIHFAVSTLKKAVRHWGELLVADDAARRYEQPVEQAAHRGKGLTVLAQLVDADYQLLINACVSQFMMHARLDHIYNVLFEVLKFGSPSEQLESQSLDGLYAVVIGGVPLKDRSHAVFDAFDHNNDESCDQKEIARFVQAVFDCAAAVAHGTATTCATFAVQHIIPAISQSGFEMASDYAGNDRQLPLEIAWMLHPNAMEAPWIERIQDKFNKDTVDIEACQARFAGEIDWSLSLGFKVVHQLIERLKLEQL